MSSLGMLAWVMDESQAEGTDLAVLMVIANGGDSWATEHEIAHSLGITLEQVAVSLFRLSVSGDLDGIRRVRDERLGVRWSDSRAESPTYQKRGGITGTKRRLVMERDLYRCVHCGTHLNLTIDHIVAEVNGGTDDEDNLQTLCQSCNSRKGAS